MIPVLGVTREFSKKHIVIDKSKNFIIIKNKYRDIYSNQNVYIKASSDMNKFSDENNEVRFSLNLKDSKKYNIKIEISTAEDDFQNVEEDLKEISNYWNDKMKSVKIYTPIESMNIIMNGWLLYQTLVCRIWARTSFYQCGRCIWL